MRAKRATLVASGTSSIMRRALTVRPDLPQAQFNLARLLEDMQLAGKRVAIERNGEIVPRSQYAAVELMADDRLEIVVAVGGG